MSTALAELVVKLTGDTSEFERSMKNASGSVESMGSKIGSAGAALGTAVVAGAALAGAALVGLGATSIGIARDFESQMAIMSTAVDPLAVGATDAAGAMQVLGDAALAVGSDTALVGVSASGAAEAITGLYKAGLTTNEIFGDLQGYLAGTAELSGALRASVDLAAASELDMVAASELAAVTLATFGGELTTTEERAEFVNSAMNNFVQTADASVASVQSLADAFVNVGPTANAMGMGVEDVNTALGIMSMRGIQGAEAGTQLKSMLLGMQKDAASAGGAMESLGVSLYDATGAMRPLPAVIADLESAMAGMTEQQRNQYITTIAGSYGMNALNSLLAEGAEGWAGMEEAIAGAATMQETAAARANTLEGAQEQLAGVIETLQIKIGTALIPVLKLLAGMGAELIERFGPVLTGAFETFAAVLTRVWDVVISFIDSFSDSGDAVGSLTGALQNLVGPTTEAGQRILEIGQRVREVKDRIMEVLGPVLQAVANFVSWKDVLIVLAGILAGVVLSAIISVVTAMAPILLVAAALVAAVALLRNAWEQNWGGIQEKTAAVVAFIQAGVGQLIAWWNTAWPTIQTTIQTVWGVIQTAIQTAVSIIGPTVQNMMATIQGAFDGGRPVIEAFRGVWEALGPLFQSIVPIVSAVGGALLSLFVGVFNGIVAAIGPLVSGIMGAVTAIIGIFKGLIQFLTGFFNLVVGLFTGNSEQVQGALNQMGQGIKTIWTNLVNGVKSLVMGFVDAIIGLVKGLVDGVIQFFTRMYNELVGGSIVPDMVNAVVNWFQSMRDWLLEILSAIQAFFTAIWNAIKSFVAAVWAAMVAKVTNDINTMRSIITTVWNAVKAFWTSTWNAIQTVTQSVWTSMRTFVTNTINNIKSLIQAFVSAVQSSWNSFMNMLTSIWNAGWTLIQNIMNTGKTTLIGIASAIVQAIFNVFNQDWGAIGRGIVDGIGNALMAGLAWVAQKAREIAEAALAAAMEALGIGSPSKEFAWLGEMSIKGYTEPFKNTRAIELAVVRAMDSGIAAGERASSQTIDRGVRIGTVNLPGATGPSIIRQFEALGVRR